MHAVYAGQLRGVADGYVGGANGVADALLYSPMVTAVVSLVAQNGSQAISRLSLNETTL